MTRSTWKNGYVEGNLFNSKGRRYGEFTLKDFDRTWSRRSIILPDLIGRTIQVHRGNGFVAIEIVAAMVGHKFGEFAFTRKVRSRRKKK